MLYLIQQFCVSCRYVVPHSVILRLMQLCCTSFSNTVSHTAMLYLIQQYCVSCSYDVPHSAILCLMQLCFTSFSNTVFHAAMFYFIQQYCVSCSFVVPHSAILCFMQLCCTSFSNTVSHAATVSVPHRTLCDYYLITCANLTFRRNSGKCQTFSLFPRGFLSWIYK